MSRTIEQTTEYATSEIVDYLFKKIEDLDIVPIDDVHEFVYDIIVDAIRDHI